MLCQLWGKVMKRCSLIIPLAVILCFLLAVTRLEDGRQAEGKQQLESVLRRAAVSCYAMEGFYPPNVEYMQAHYGVRFDEESYVVHYELFASNWMPDITVLERKP